MYYYIAEVSKDLISIKRDASTEEYNKIEPHIKMISKMLVDKNRIEPVIFAYKKLIESISSLSSQTDMYESRNIQYNLSQYLFEFKKFLDKLSTFECDCNNLVNLNISIFQKIGKKIIVRCTVVETERIELLTS